MANEQAIELFSAAQRDCVTYQILRRAAEAPFETTMFHAQQVVEKAIKAVLVQQGIVFRRTHDLLELYDIATIHDIKIPVMRDLLLRLAPYAVEYRYLGIRAPQVALAEADAAVDAMMEWASTRLGLSE